MDNGPIVTGASPGKLRQLNGNGQLFIGKLHKNTLTLVRTSEIIICEESAIFFERDFRGSAKLDVQMASVDLANVPQRLKTTHFIMTSYFYKSLMTEEGRF